MQCYTVELNEIKKKKEGRKEGRGGGREGGRNHQSRKEEIGIFKCNF